MTLRTKLLSMTVLLSVVPLAIITFLLLGQSHAALEKTAHMTESGLHETTDAAKEALIESEFKHLRQIAGDLYTMCAAQQSLLVKKLHSDLAVATRVLSDAGEVTFAQETVSWTAKNQYTKDTKNIELPKLLVGETWTGNVTDAATHVPIVDEVQDLVGGTCTVFQRMNEDGDMLRVATNVITDAGTRAVGTYIPAKHPNGKRNAVVAKLLSGETFFGRAYVVNAWYITAYQPILDTDGKVAGALYVGVKEQSTDSIREAVLATKAGKSGYAFVINAKGQTRGHYVISKDGASDGADIWDVKDSEGRLFVQDMCKTAVDLRPGEIAETRYPWANAGEQPRDKITMYAYFEPWDWLIGVGAYEDEFYEPVRAMEERAAATLAQSREVMEHAESTVTKWGLVLGGLTLVTSVLISLFVVRGITKPINRIISALTEGARQVTDASGQVSKTSQQLAEGASEQASSLEETSSALEQMAAMTRTNAENAKQANELSAQARDAAQSGDQTMKRLNGAMDAINQSSGEISKIIKVIEEIAFQTNLLALNAAVEAARAGEHGKGFAVVAEEVRNLAQRAAQAAGETTALIEQSVGRAKEGGDVARDVAEALGAIVGDVAQVSELIEGIAKASEEQAQGVEQVNTAVGQMDAVTQSNAAGAEESASAAEELSAQASTVNGVVGELAAIIGGTATRQTQEPTTNRPAPPSRCAQPPKRRSTPQPQQYEGKASGSSPNHNTQNFSDF